MSPVSPTIHNLIGSCVLFFSFDILVSDPQVLVKTAQVTRPGALLPHPIRLLSLPGCRGFSHVRWGSTLGLRGDVLGLRGTTLGPWRGSLGLWKEFKGRWSGVSEAWSPTTLQMWGEGEQGLWRKEVRSRLSKWDRYPRVFRRRPRATEWDPAGVQVSYNEGMRKRRRGWFAGLSLALLAACVGVGNWSEEPSFRFMEGSTFLYCAPSPMKSGKYIYLFASFEPSLDLLALAAAKETNTNQWMHPTFRSADGATAHIDWPSIHTYATLDVPPLPKNTTYVISVEKAPTMMDRVKGWLLHLRWKGFDP